VPEQDFNLDDYVKRGERFVTRKESIAKNTLEVPEPEAAPMQILEGLFAIRESSEFDYGLFEGMIEQVLQPVCAEYPELQPLMVHGSRVLRPNADGVSLRKHLGAEPLYGNEGRNSKPTGWAINVGRCRVLYALTSAGKTDSTGLENSWVNILCDEIRANVPKHLYTGPFSRLLRNKDVSAQLKVALRKAGTRVHCSESREGFFVNNETGSVVWHALVDAAHSEWISTLTRLQTGTIFHAKQGKWPRGGPIPVVGYKRVDEIQGGPSLIAPDESQRVLVRTIIESAASGMSEEEAVKLMSSVGVRSRKPRGKGVEQPLLEELGDPKSALRHVWQHLPTYLSGEYLFMQNNTVPGLNSTFGIPVYRTNQDDLGHFQLKIPFGLPEGGWHDEETIKQAIKRRLSPHQKGGGKKDPNELIKPLSGQGSWVTGGYEYRLMTDDETYQVRRRPHEATKSGVFKGFGPYEGDLAGRFSVAGLHRTVASLLRDLVLEVTNNVECVHISNPEPAELAELLERADKAKQLATRLREFAAGTLDPGEQLAYRAQASEQHSLGQSLLQEHADLLRVQERKVSLADTDQILATAEILARSSGGEPPIVRKSLQRIIGSLRIVTEIHEPVAEVILTAVVRTNHGTVTLGPISRKIVSTAGTKRVKPDRNKASERNIRLVHSLLTNLPNTPIREILDLSGRQERRRMVLVMQNLLPNPYAASAFLDCPIPAVQRVVLNELFKEPDYAPLELPKDLDPLWTQEIAAIYMARDWDWIKRSWASGDLTWAREFVGWVHRYHGDENGVVMTDARKLLGLNETQIYSLLSKDVDRYRQISRSSSTPVEYTKMHKKYAKSSDPRRIRITTCPHCGTRELPHLLRVPELRDGFLCSTCRKPPQSKIVYPIEYLNPWVGPNQGNRKLKTEEQDKARLTRGTHLFPFHIPPQVPMRK
jgi:hypothetical protein